MSATAGRRKRRRIPHLTPESRQIWAVSGSALLVQVAPIELVGMPLVDVLWKAVIAGAAAYVASTSKRLFLVAGAMLVTVTSQTALAVLLGLAAIVFGALTTRRIHRRSVFLRGACGGVAVVSLMVSGADRPGWHTIVVSALLAGAVAASGFRHASSRARKAMAWTAAGVAGFLVAASAAALVAIAQEASSVDAAVDELRTALDLARLGDTEGATQHFERAGDLADAAEESIARLGGPARLVPLVGPHVDVLVRSLDGAGDIAGQAATTTGIVRDGALETKIGRIDIEAIEDVRLPLRRLATLLGSLDEDLAASEDDPLLPVLRRKIDQLSDLTARASDETQRAAQAADVMPAVLGGDGPRRYLVLFTSPSEARGRFGFPGSFAEVILDEGRLTLGEQGTTSSAFQQEVYSSDAFDRFSSDVTPYLGFGATSSIRSSTIPPDFPTVTRIVAAQWEQSGREPLDGVLRFDPTSLAPMLDWTGPVTAAGAPEPLTSVNLVKYLELDQYLQFPDEQAPRREVLDDVAEETFERLVVADLPAPRLLAQTYAPLVDAGHLQVSTFDAEAARFFHDVGLDGALEPPAVDGLLVTTVNNSGNKVDVFLSKTVAYEATVDDGRLEGRLSVELRNAAPADGLPFYVIGSFTQPPLPPGTNKSTVLMYTTAEPTSASIAGRRVESTIVRTGGRWLTLVSVELPPGGAARIDLDLEGQVGEGQDYRLELLPGGGPTPDRYQARIDRKGLSGLRSNERVDRPLTVR